MDYQSSGVNIDAGNETVRRIKRLAKSTFTPEVLSDIGAFGGLFNASTLGLREPVLVASADGVGTKLKVAFLADRHDSVGADLVNHCVNDILVQGAVPLFFLDYLATGRLSPAVAEQIVSGMTTACRVNGCALIGGETAEMPGFYADGEYDLAGFIVGVVERRQIIDGHTLGPGDVLIGLPSTGLHTNGYSLARRIIFDVLGLGIHDVLPGLGVTAADALLATHRTYLPVLRPLIDREVAKGLAHVTGGGITENLPRILPHGVAAEVRRDAWPVPGIFRLLQDVGHVADDEMYRTFNMGIGLIVACAGGDADHVLATLRAAGEERAAVIGTLVHGDRVVIYA
jgi:phosphoribosylformylglycinamidine cyclo-ligase